MADVRLNLLLTGIDQSVKEIKSFSSSVEKQFSGLTKSVGLLGNAFGALGVGITFKAIIDEAIQGEKSLKQLENALRLTGEASKETVKDLDEFSTSLSLLSTFDDDAIRSQVAFVKSLGATNDQAKALIQTAADLAAVTGDSLDASVQQLTGTYSGQARTLAKLFPELKNFTEQQLRSGEAVDFISGKLSGSAQKGIQGFSGQLNLASKLVGEISEELGKLFIIGNKQTGFLSNVVESLKTVLSALETFNSVLAVEPIQAFGDAIKFVIADIIKLFIQLNQIIAETLAQIPVIGGIFSTASQAANPLLVKINQFQDSLFKTTDETKSLNKELGKVAAPKGFGAGLTQEIENSFDALKKNLNNVGLTQLEILKKEKLERLLLAQQVLEAQPKRFQEIKNIQLQIEKDFLNKVDKLNEENAKKEEARLEGRRKQLKEEAESVQKLATLNFDAIFGDTAGAGATKVDPNKAAAAGTAGFVNQALKGVQGATALITDSIGLIANTLIPGIGGVVSEIFNVFAQGPEKIRELISGFFESFPIILENIVLAVAEFPIVLAENIGPFLEKLIDSVPRIVDSIIAKLPDLLNALLIQIPIAVQKFSTELSARAPFIAAQTAAAFVREVPNMVKEMVNAFVNEIKGAFDFLGIGGGGGDGGGLLSDIGGFFGFASGGTFSGGIPFRDSIPAMVQRDETIITDELTRKLDSFLNEQGNRNNGSSQPTTVILQVGEEQLARVMLNLNRQNFRTA